jgi:hypothetical protein
MSKLLPNSSLGRSILKNAFWIVPPQLLYRHPRGKRSTPQEHKSVIETSKLIGDEVSYTAKAAGLKTGGA